MKQADNSAAGSTDVRGGGGRIGLLPEPKPGTRGHDWEGGRSWSYSAETFRKARPPRAHRDRAWAPAYKRLQSPLGFLRAGVC